MKKILTVVGARPQFIKAGIVSRCLERDSKIKEVIVHTGQHYDNMMSNVFFEEMQIPQPAYNLQINNLSHGKMTGKMLEGLEQIMLDEKPELVLVYGDTNSTLAGALAAKKMHIQVAHVEGGLRSFNMNMPEEINRILTDRVSDILYCPTETAVKNLFNEGFKNFDCSIIKNGDVMKDASMMYADIAMKRTTILEELGLKNFILGTIHRAENTDQPERLRSIFSALDQIHNEIEMVLPLHPRTQKILEESNIKTRCTVLEPLGYLSMMALLKGCSLVITDSGGLQKEAYFFSKPCVTIRDETEWTELVEGGYNVLSGSETEKIYQCYQLMINKHSDFRVELYGNGNAGQLIVETLHTHLC